MKFKVSEKIIEDYPDVCEYIVVAKGLNNEIAAKWINDRLQEVYKQLRSQGEDMLKEAKFQVWMDIYESIQKDVKGRAGDEAYEEYDSVLPAHVSLAKRVLDGDDLPNINPLVNFYNLYSLKYGIPIGGEDLSKVYGDLELSYAKGDEKSLLLGEEEVSEVFEREIIWKDDHSATCRMWNWSQSERTKVTKYTEDVYFIFDTFGSIDLAQTAGGESDRGQIDLEEIVKKFADEIEEMFGGETVIKKIHKDSTAVEFDYETKDISSVKNIEKDLEQLLEKKKKRNKAAQRFMKRRLEPIGLLDKDQMFVRIENLIADTLETGLSKEFDQSGRGEIKDLSEYINLEIPASSDFGDLASSMAMKLAPKLKNSPKRIAESVAELLEKNEEITAIFNPVEVAPNGFLNFYFSDKYLLEALKQSFMDEDFGGSDVGEGKSMLIESPSINPNAPAHIGHLLNLFIGRALARLFRKTGFEVDIDNLINDRGIKICQAMWGIQNLAEADNPKQADMKGDHFVGKYYSLAVQKYNSDEKAKKEMDQMLRDWESGKEEVIKFWKKMIDWAFAGHLQTFRRVGEERGHLWLESEIYKKGKDVILAHMEEGVVDKLPDGAVIGRLEEKYGVDDVILLRSDGTSIYHTQDVYLTIQKIKKFDPWKAIWVVGNEQIAHFQKLFALLDNLEILDLDNLYHLPYGMVVKADGSQYSSRKGDAVSADGFLDMVHEEALKLIDQRDIDVELEDKDKVAETVGIGALRYTLLSRDPYKDIKFDPEESLSFTGRSGPYVMYAYSRGKSVLRKLNENNEEDVELINLKADADDVEITEIDRELILKLLKYPKVVLDSASNFSASILADYLFELASCFNNFYENEPVMGSEGDTKNLRVLLTKMSTRVIKDGAEILGIDVLERM